MNPPLPPASAPVISGFAMLITAISGIGCLLTLTGGCMLVLMTPCFALSVLAYLIFIAIPLLYRKICTIPIPNSASAASLTALIVLGVWFLVFNLSFMARNTYGLGHCIA